jgi:hypothetical protein
MKYEGYVPTHKLPLRPGDVVTIPQGISFKSTHPKKGSGVTGRSYKVRVDHILNGFKGSEDIGGSTRVANPEVRWGGAGNYWKWVDINDIREANLALFEARERSLNVEV